MTFCSHELPILGPRVAWTFLTRGRAEDEEVGAQPTSGSASCYGEHQGFETQKENQLQRREKLVFLVCLFLQSSGSVAWQEFAWDGAKVDLQ